MDEKEGVLRVLSVERIRSIISTYEGMFTGLESKYRFLEALQLMIQVRQEMLRREEAADALGIEEYDVTQAPSPEEVSFGPSAGLHGSLPEDPEKS